MGKLNRMVKIASFALVGLGVALLALSIATRGAVNVALPLVFLMLGGAFFILVLVLAEKWAWAVLGYVPACLMLALGVIFLLNVLTNDWNAWAYAWLLLVTGIGAGLVLANAGGLWRREVTLAGWIAAAAGITLFALFGAIAGGPFIYIMAPILLVVGGLALRWLRPEKILPPAGKRDRLEPAPPVGQAPGPGQPEDLPPVFAAQTMVEPLSARELDVLRLVGQGLSNPEIAARLVLAPSTVKTHINNIYGKLGVQTRLQAVQRARELGLL
jgi:DNA-binding CsgD family transcriptional regulator